MFPGYFGIFRHFDQILGLAICSFDFLIRIPEVSEMCHKEMHFFVRQYLYTYTGI